MTVFYAVFRLQVVSFSYASATNKNISIYLLGDTDIIKFVVFI